MECLIPTLIAISLVVYNVSALNCSYELLEISLMNSKENRYELSRAFFPPVDNPPEFVTVNYSFPDINQNKLWFWSAFSSGFIHPPEVLQYMSLFFAKPHAFYNGSVNLVLDNITSETADCADDLLKMQLLTQRLQLYAAQQATPLKVDGNYRAKAFVPDQEDINDTLKVTIEQTISNNNLVEYITAIIIPLAVIFICIILIILCLSKRKDWDSLLESRIPLICALAIISLAVTIYNLALSGYSLQTWNTNKPFDYYKIYIKSAGRIEVPIRAILVIDTLCLLFCLAMIALSAILMGTNCKCNEKHPTQKKDGQDACTNAKPDKADTKKSDTKANKRHSSCCITNSSTDEHTDKNITRILLEERNSSKPDSSSKADDQSQLDSSNVDNQQHTPDTSKAQDQRRVPDSSNVHDQPCAPNAKNKLIANTKESVKRFCLSVKWYEVLSLTVICPIVSIICHSPYIAIAYLDDAHHAGSIFIYYTIVLCIAYSICWITFHPLKSILHECSCQSQRLPKVAYCLIVTLGTLCLVVFLAVVGTTITYFVVIPINKSISDAPNRLVGIYQSGGFLIGAFVIYKLIGFFYHYKLSNLEKAIIDSKVALNDKEENSVWMDKPSKKKLSDFYEGLIRVFSVHLKEANKPETEEREVQTNGQHGNKTEDEERNTSDKRENNTAAEGSANPNGQTESQSSSVQLLTAAHSENKTADGASNTTTQIKTQSSDAELLASDHN